MVVGQGEPLTWRLSQVLGERVPGEPIEHVDIISALEFDKSGDYLAVGDHGGRLIIFERTNIKDIKASSRRELEHSDSFGATPPIYAYKTEFSSHEPEFDYLKSLEIEEKINQLQWLRTVQNSSFILTTNPKTIKLWKVVDRKVKKVKELNPNQLVCAENAILAGNSFINDSNGQVVPSNYRLEWRNKKPKRIPIGSPAHCLMPYIGKGTSKCRKVYTHAHEYNINSISINSDCETFLSADDLRINLWNVEISSQCFNIVDMKPPNMEDLMEVITSAKFHPTYCNLLAYSSSRGFIRLADLRQSALCDKSARILQDIEAHTSQSLFTEIIRSITDIKFTSDGMCLLSRDFMNLKLWDIRMEKFPIATFKVHEYLHPKACNISEDIRKLVIRDLNSTSFYHHYLCIHEGPSNCKITSMLSELYNSDTVFDKFKCCSSSNGLHFATGSYSNIFKVFSCKAKREDHGTTLEASKNVNRIPAYCATPKATRAFYGTPRAMRLLPSVNCGSSREGSYYSSYNGGSAATLDLTAKVINLAWHPTSNLIACAAANSLYMHHS